MRLIYFLPVLFLLALSHNARSQATLIASYDFTGGSGADASGNGYTGTLNGASANGDTLNIGYNTADYFIVPAAVLNNRLQFSMTFKVKFTGFNTTGSSPTNNLLTCDNSSTAGTFEMSYQKDVTKWRVAYNNTAYDFTDASIVAGQWYCVALTRNSAGVMKLYVNGVQNAATNTLTATLNITNIIIGQETDCFAGCFAANQSAYAKFDDLKFYNDDIGPTSAIATCDLVAGIKTENNALAFAVGPNPASDQLNLYNLKQLNGFGLNISSVDGKVVKDGFYKNGSDVSLDVKDLQPGLYFITLSHDTQRAVLRFIKE